MKTKHSVAMHETRHLMGAAVGLVAQQIDRKAYEGVTTLIDVRDDQGEAAIVPPDGIDVTKLAGHAAVAPLAARHDLAKVGITKALADDHDLSGSDLERIGTSGESPFALLLTCRAVQLLEARLGGTKIAALARLVSRSSSACEGELPLSSIAPLTVVREALHAARSELVEPPTIKLTAAQNDRMSPAKKLRLGQPIEVVG